MSAELDPGSGSFWAASVDVAFLAERLCLASLAFTFLEVLILARRSNKEHSEYTVYLGPPMKQRTVSAHCRSLSVGILDVCHVIGCITEMCRTRNRYLLCRTFIVSVATDSQAADKISCCQTEIEGRGAARWRGPPGRPEKAALDRYSWGRDSGPCPRALPDQNRGPRSSALAGANVAPRKSSLGPLLGVMRTLASPALSASELTKNRSNGM